MRFQRGAQLIRRVGLGHDLSYTTALHNFSRADQYYRMVIGKYYLDPHGCLRSKVVALRGARGDDPADNAKHKRSEFFLKCHAQYRGRRCVRIDQLAGQWTADLEEPKTNLSRGQAALHSGAMKEPAPGLNYVGTSARCCTA